MSSSVSGLGGFWTMYLKHFGLFSKARLQTGRRDLPLSFDRTSVAVCILYQDESRSHLLSRSLAAYA